MNRQGPAGYPHTSRGCAELRRDGHFGNELHGNTSTGMNSFPSSYTTALGEDRPCSAEMMAAVLTWGAAGSPGSLLAETWPHIACKLHHLHRRITRSTWDFQHSPQGSLSGAAAELPLPLPRLGSGSLRGSSRTPGVGPECKEAAGGHLCVSFATSRSLPEPRFSNLLVAMSISPNSQFPNC